jgi:hypothetical protein
MSLSVTHRTTAYSCVIAEIGASRLIVNVGKIQILMKVQRLSCVDLTVSER